MSFSTPSVPDAITVALSIEALLTQNKKEAGTPTVRQTRCPFRPISQRGNGISEREDDQEPPAWKTRKSGLETRKKKPPATFPSTHLLLCALCSVTTFPPCRVIRLSASPPLFLFFSYIAASHTHPGPNFAARTKLFREAYYRYLFLVSPLTTLTTVYNRLQPSTTVFPPLPPSHGSSAHLSLLFNSFIPSFVSVLFFLLFLICLHR